MASLLYGLGLIVWLQQKITTRGNNENSLTDAFTAINPACVKTRQMRLRIFGK
jgi:hypothetical protein